MTETNLNIVLSNALCCSSQLAAKVGKLYDTGNLCVDTEFDKLKLLIDKIEVLKCYDFPAEPLGIASNSEFDTILSQLQYNLLSETTDSIIELDVNGVTYVLYSDSVLTNIELIINKLTELGIFIFYSLTETNLELVLTCDVLSFGFNITLGERLFSTYVFTNTVPGFCTNYVETSVENCLTEEQADIMMHDVMRQCGICDCQLTT
jgi:hypothetical protein